MNYLNVDYLIVYAFLLITLIIGLRAGKGIKDIREYTLANKMYGTGTLLLTFLATNVCGAGTVGLASDIFSDGVGMVASLSGVAISLIIIAIFVAPKIVLFDQCLTIGDVMGVLYGKYSRVITGLLGTLYSVCMISMELFVLGLICEPLFGINSVDGVIVGGTILTLYTAHGGIKSVTITDVVQFLLAIVTLPLIASIAVNHAGGIEAVFNQIPAHKLNVLEHEHFSYYLTLFLVWSIFPVASQVPHSFNVY
jgi:Na+/proline symporter